MSDTIQDNDKFGRRRTDCGSKKDVGMKKAGVVALFVFALSVHAGLVGHFTAEDGLTLINENQVALWINQVVNNDVSNIEVETPANATYDALSVMDSGRSGVRWNRAGRASIISSKVVQELLGFSEGSSGQNRGLTVLFAFEPLSLSEENNVISSTAHLKTPGFRFSFGEDGRIELSLNDTSNLGLIRGSVVPVGRTVVAGFAYSARTGDVIYWDSMGTSSVKRLADNATFSDSTVYFAGSGNKREQTDGIFGELRIYDEVLEASAFGALCREMVSRWCVSVPVKNQVVTESIAKTPLVPEQKTLPDSPPAASAPSKSPAPSEPVESSESPASVYGLFSIAAILLLLFRLR